ncbi:MAG: hypothetical protein IT273_03575 [Chitinophagales bacterium]|nr:hypothetical protein [Chitinophagales bacterium]
MQYIDLPTFANTMLSCTTEQLRELLDQLLLHLRQYKITVQEIGHQTNLKALSKWRHGHLSQKHGSLMIAPAIKTIISHYQCRIIADAQQATGYRFETPDLAASLVNIPSHYLYYYYSLNDQCCERAHLVIDGAGKTAQLSFYKQQKLVHSYPKAQLVQQGTHVFMKTLHPDSQHQSLTIWYCGNYTLSQLPVLAGIYNGVRQRDGAIVSGRVLLQRISPSEHLPTLLAQPIPAAIVSWVQRYCEVDNRLVFDIDELRKLNHIPILP